MDISKERLVSLKNEILMARKLNEEELQPIVSESIERYTGVHTPAYGVDWDIVLNEVYPIIQYSLPAIFFRNPRVFLKPRHKTFIAKARNPISGEMEEMQLDSTKSAKTQEAILNYLLTEIKYKRETRKILLDALLFPHGVLWHGYKGEFGMTEEQSLDIKEDRIFVKRISPLRFIKDPSVSISNIDEAKWVGRVIDIPFVDLIEDDKLDVDKNLVKGFKGYGDKVGKNTEQALMQLGGQDKIRIGSTYRSLVDYADKDFQNSRYAKFVRVFEVYLRATKKEAREGSKGWILLLTDEQQKPLRQNEWKIKAEGFPSKILEFNELPDSKFGMSDIDTYKQVADQKNVIVNLQLRNAQENSKVWVGISKEGSNEEDIDAVRKGDQTIVMFESGNPRDRMFVASPGGAASSELYLIDGRIQRNLEDKSGVSDLKRGFLQSGEESAASVKIRNAGGGARPAYRQDIMADFLKESLLYLNQMNKQFMTIKDAVRIIGSLDVQWSENPTKEELQADVDVELDVISMLPESPEKELMALNTILALMFQGFTNPEIRQKIMQEGKTFNFSPVIEQILMRSRINDPEIFRNIKPEESMGFASVQQLRQAEANVQAAVTGQQVPFPPKPEDDHVTKLTIYTSMQQLFQQMGQVSDMLNELIQIHSALLQQIQEKQAQPGQMVKLNKPTMQTVGQ